ncbi:MAG: S9 family peptidase [Acidimicrobiia bacterium]|nr:S9 family peptidase [Acidimicrobiia bacterium]
MSRPITSQDLWNLPRVEAPAVSPDGTTIIVPVTHYDVDANEGRTTLYLIEAEGPRPLTDRSRSATAPAISADGRSIAFVRKDDEGNPQVHLLSLDGGEVQRLTDCPLGATGPRWLPDGRLVVVVKLLRDAPTSDGTRELIKSRADRKSTARITERRNYRYWDTWLTAGEMWHPFVLDPDSGRLADLTPDRHWWWRLPTQGDPADAFDIAPDGSEISFTAWEVDDLDEIPIWRLYSVDTSGGETVCRTPDLTGDATWPRYTPDGRSLAYLFQVEPDFYADRRRLAVIDRATDRHRVLTEEWDASIGTIEPSFHSNELFLTAEEAGRVLLFRIGLDGGTPERVAGEGTLTNPRPTRDGSVYMRHQSLSRPPEIVRIDTSDGSLERVTRFSDEVLADVAFGAVEELTLEGADGQAVQVFVVFPPDFDREVRWPLVHLIHGGPHSTFGDMWHFRWNAQAFAAPGYVVAMVNFHGSTSFGDSFTRAIHARWGDQPTTDVLAATDMLIDSGWIDPARMAITGGSYGGYLTAWIMSQTDRFACAIAHAAVTNLGGMYATDMTYGMARSRGAEVWEDPQQVERWSPSAHAAGYATPTLVIGGEGDFRVPITQSLELYGVLKAKGVPARLVCFPDENHWILKPQNSLVWYQEVHDWLARWLSH